MCPGIHYVYCTVGRQCFGIPVCKQYTHKGVDACVYVCATVKRMQVCPKLRTLGHGPPQRAVVCVCVPVCACVCASDPSSLSEPQGLDFCVMPQDGKFEARSGEEQTQCGLDWAEHDMTPGRHMRDCCIGRVLRLLVTSTSGIVFKPAIWLKFSNRCLVGDLLFS